MRQFIISILLLSLFSFSSAVAAPTGKLPKVFAKKWKLDLYIMYKVKYRPSFKEKKDMLEMNRTDSTFVRINEGKQMKGKWDYDKKKKELYLMPLEGEKITYRILSKKKKELVYTSDETNHNTTIYLIPFDEVSKYVKKAEKRKKKKAKARKKAQNKKK